MALLPNSHRKYGVDIEYHTEKDIFISASSFTPSYNTKGGVKFEITEKFDEKHPIYKSWLKFIKEVQKLKKITGNWTYKEETNRAKGFVGTVCKTCGYIRFFDKKDFDEILIMLNKEH